MRRLWRRHPRLVAAFLLATVLAVAFSGLALRRALHWPGGDPGPVEAWMTPRFVVHAYGIPPEVVAEVLGAQPGDSPRDTLAGIAAARGVPVADLITAIEAERTRLQGGHD